MFFAQFPLKAVSVLHGCNIRCVAVREFYHLIMLFPLIFAGAGKLSLDHVLDKKVGNR